MKYRILIRAFLFLALVGSASARIYTTSAQTSPVIYPAPDGESPSALFEVQVADEGIMRSSFVYFDPARDVITPRELRHRTSRKAAPSTGPFSKSTGQPWCK